MSSGSDWLAAGSAAGSTLVILAGGLVAYRQLRTANRTLKVTQSASTIQALTAALAMVTGDEEAFKSRRWLYDNADRLKNRGAWNDSVARQHAEVVCRAWDRMGLLVKYGDGEGGGVGVIREPVLDMWGVPIIRLYGILEPYIAERRARRGSNPGFAHNFEWLCAEAERFVNPPPDDATGNRFFRR